QCILVHRLERSGRVDQQHVYPPSTQRTLGACRQQRLQPHLALQKSGRLDEQIDVTSPGGVVHAGAEQQDAAVLAHLSVNLLLEETLLLWRQAYGERVYTRVLGAELCSSRCVCDTFLFVGARKFLPGKCIPSRKSWEFLRSVSRSVNETPSNH